MSNDGASRKSYQSNAGHSTTQHDYDKGRVPPTKKHKGQTEVKEQPEDEVYSQETTLDGDDNGFVVETQFSQTQTGAKQVLANNTNTLTPTTPTPPTPTHLPTRFNASNIPTPAAANNTNTPTPTTPTPPTPTHLPTRFNASSIPTPAAATPAGGASDDNDPNDVNFVLPPSFFVRPECLRAPSGATVWAYVNLRGVVWLLTKKGVEYFESKGTNATHICRAVKEDGCICNTTMKCFKVKKSTGAGVRATYVSSTALVHLLNNHPNHPAAVASNANKITAGKHKFGVMLEADTEVSSVSSASSPFSTSSSSTSSSKFTSTSPSQPKTIFQVNNADANLSRMVKWFVYSKMNLPKNVFEEDEFRKMSPHLPIMTSKALSMWVKAEFEVFLRFLRFMLLRKHTEAGGNPCCQAIHDGGTLNNRRKYQSLGLQFVGAKFCRNFVVAVALTVTEDGTASVVAKKFDDILKERVGLSTKDLVYSLIADGAAQKVGTELDILSEICMMHAVDKLAKSGAGDLVRSRKGIAVNPFPKCQELFDKLHTVAVHFSYGCTRIDKLHKYCSVSTSEQDCKWTVPKLDLNETRIASRLALIKSMIRLYPGLKLYAGHANTNGVPEITDDDWQNLVEVDAVLTSVAIVTTEVQNEKAFVGSYSILLKQRLWSQLNCVTLKVVDLEKVTSSHIIPTIDRPVADASEIGKEILSRSKLEFQRRFAETSFLEEEMKYQVSNRELVSAICDPRTVNSLPTHLLDSGKAAFVSEYILYGVGKDRFDEDLRKSAATTAMAQTEIANKSARSSERGRSSSKKVHVKFETGSTGLGWGDDESDDDDDNDVVVVPLATRLREDANRVLKAFIKHAKKLDWVEMFPDLKKTLEETGKDTIGPFDLMRVDMAKVYESFPKGEFGLIPDLACSSVGSIGACLSESFAERMFSVANDVSTKMNTRLSDDEIEKLVLLKINKEFMKYMREKHGSEARQNFNDTIVEVQEEDDDDDDE